MHDGRARVARGALRFSKFGGCQASVSHLGFWLCFFLFVLSPHRSTRPTAVNPQFRFRPFHALYLTNRYRRAIRSRVRQTPSSADSCFLFPPNPCFSPARRTHQPPSPSLTSISFYFLAPSSLSPFPATPPRPPGIVSQHSDVQRSSRFSIYPFSFQGLANSFAFSKGSTLLFSSNSELFTAKHRGAGCPQRSKVQTSDVPALPIRPIAAERLWCNNSQRHGNSSRSEETTALPSVSKTSERTSGIARRRSRFTPIQSGL